MKKSVAKAKAKSEHAKKIQIHPKHGKAYRKRHYGLLIASLAVALVVFALAIQLRIKSDAGLHSARDFINSMLNTSTDSKQAVNSSYGFSFSYDPAQFYASAVDGSTGALYIGQDLNTARPYQTLRLSSTSVDPSASQSALTVDYVVATAVPANAPLEGLEKQLVVNKQSSESTLTKQSSETVTIGGKQFLKTNWKQQPKDVLTSRFESHFTTYIAIVSGKPLVIKANYGLTDQPDSSTYNDIVNSFTFGQQAQAPVAQPTVAVAAEVEKSRSLLDTVLFTQVARAATQAGSSEYTSSLYAPAVVKIFNVYCMDIQTQGKLYLTDACSASTGSGFFISSDGYIASNGHVVAESPKDIVINHAVYALIDGDQRYFSYLAQVAGLTDADLAGAKDENDALDIAVDKLYEIPDSTFTATNNVSNLLVNLNDKQPDTKELVAKTKARSEYAGDENIKRAELVASDYRLLDGITKFHASDVAIIKIEGQNYPIVKLGNISEATQGSNLTILGFPGNASNNGIIDATQSKVTLTTGKVSSVKNATGSDKKLIETDTTIGHGNSGGPAFSDSGSVVGIATYTADGAGKGDGTFNYIRDVKDMIDLAGSSSVSLQATSKTQVEWQKGIAAFHTAHYSKAVKSFDKVKQLYPQHPTVNDFIANSQQKIANGEDVKDFPVLIVAITGVIAVSGVAVAAFLIIRHHGKHQIYKVASGQAVAAPAGFGNITQSVSIPSIPQPQAPAAPQLPQQPQAPAAPQAPAPQPPAQQPTVIQPQTPQPPQQPPTPPIA